MSPTRWLFALMRFWESLRPVNAVPLTKERKRWLYQVESRREQ